MGVEFGYTLSSEETPPRRLVELAAAAEEAEFSFVSISDHFHPWIREQGHSPFVWAVLGAIAGATEHVQVGIGVSCPIVRMHPAVVAQAAATTSLLLDGRLVLGVGTGEALNEHVVGARWPSPEIRREMLEEAIGILRALWTGDVVDHRGRHYEVENARLFDPPATQIPVVVSGFGTEAAELAGRVGDGFWGTKPDRRLLDAFERAGGGGPRYAQLSLCWGQTEDEAKATVHRMWPTGGLSGQLAQDLPTWTHFEQATSVLTIEQTTDSTSCGPDIAEPLFKSVAQYVEAGYDHLYFHQIGPDQDGFFRFWTDHLRPAPADVSVQV